jgi:hypothetical protein
MIMALDQKDQDIVKLLAKLKSTEAQYPEQMFVARRQMYLRRMAEIGMGIGLDAGLKDPVKAPAPSTTSPALLEAALVLAIIVEATAVAYFYREKLADFFQTITSEPLVREVTPLPVASNPTEIQGITPSPAVTALTPTVALPSATLSSSPAGAIVTLTRTPVPGVAEDNNDSGGASVGPSQGNSTPVPSGNTGDTGNTGNTGDNDDQGNHYGQTPKPERTIEPGGNIDNPPQDNSNNSPTQDTTSDQGTNNNGKPPKTP